MWHPDKEDKKKEKKWEGRCVLVLATIGEGEDFRSKGIPFERKSIFQISTSMSSFSAPVRGDKRRARR